MGADYVVYDVKVRGGRQAWCGGKPGADFKPRSAP